MPDESGCQPVVLWDDDDIRNQASLTSAPRRRRAGFDYPPVGQPDRPESGRSGWRADGVLKNLHLGSRTIDVEDVTLSIETHTVVLIDCRRASLRELREGASVAALYEDRAGRHVVTVLDRDRQWEEAVTALRVAWAERRRREALLLVLRAVAGG